MSCDGQSLAAVCFECPRPRCLSHRCFLMTCDLVPVMTPTLPAPGGRKVPWIVHLIVGVVFCLDTGITFQPLLPSVYVYSIVRGLSAG